MRGKGAHWWNEGGVPGFSGSGKKKKRQSTVGQFTNVMSFTREAQQTALFKKATRGLFVGRYRKKKDRGKSLQIPVRDRPRPQERFVASCTLMRGTEGERDGPPHRLD